MPLKFQTKLILFYVLLFAAVEVATLGLVFTAAKSHIVDQSRKEFLAVRSNLENWLADTTHRLTEAAKVLSSDFGFRGAVATGDRPTLASAIDNLRIRVNADRAWVFMPDGNLLADSAASGEKLFPYADFLAGSGGEDRGAAVASVGDRIYQLVVAPILAPDLLGYVCFGVELDDPEARRLQSQSTVPLDVSFAHRSSAGPWRLVASTLDAGMRAEMPEAINRLPAETDKAAELPVVALEGERFITLTIPLHSPPGQTARVVVQRSLVAALVPFRPLFAVLLGLAALGLAVTALGSVLIGRGISRPVRVLAEAAGRVGGGDYSRPVPVSSRDELGRLASTFNTMMTGIAEREREIEFHATHDRLTGLPNRRYFETYLDRAIAGGGAVPRNFSVLLIKVENFTEINNTLGHAIGDGLLVRIGERLGSLGVGGPIARAADSDFLVFLDGADSESAKAMAERYIRRFDAPFSMESLDLDIALRVGLVAHPEHGADRKTLMRRAEVALASIKGGIGRYAVYDAAKDPYRPELLSLMADLRLGLERGDLALHYQPKVELGSGRIRKVEALVRWQHPRHGFVPPDRFIPVAERTGHIYHLTRWVISRALRDTQRWRGLDLDITAAVNLSTADLLDAQLPDFIAAGLERYGLATGDLTVEVTESAAMENPDCAIAHLVALRDMGIRIAIDDYGTGYSSLAYIKRLPVDEIKIDKTFVLDLATDENDEVIVRTTIDLGHNLGLTVTAEGVENEASLAKLRKFGCDFGQGYFFSRPVPVDGLERFLAGST
jgi:diguanylate cyclase (GGDEF)-like protein